MDDASRAERANLALRLHSIARRIDVLVAHLTAPVDEPWAAELLAIRLANDVVEAAEPLTAGASKRPTVGTGLASSSAPA